MLDPVDFKEIDDRRGHLVGDAVLRAQAQVCECAAAPNDVVARDGGEEFVVLMPGADTPVAQALGARLLAELAALAVPAETGALAAARASVGVAGLADGTHDLEAWCARADAAKSGAKRTGKNRVVVQ
jgi:diguanylate cyclase (GGDEF)-like protein